MRQSDGFVPKTHLVGVLIEVVGANHCGDADRAAAAAVRARGEARRARRGARGREGLRAHLLSGKHD